MSAILEPIEKQGRRVAGLPLRARPTGQGELLTLRGISFDTFARLAREPDEGSASRPRLYFADNTLEVWMPSEAHEELNRIVALFITLVYGVWDIEARDLGSMTHQDPATDWGFEPDTCFYEDVVTDGETVSRPLLAVEMERTHSALAKLPIYAAYGMPEVWRVSLSDVGDLQARFYRLGGGAYTEVGESVAVTPLTPDRLCGFLRARMTEMRLGAWIASVQDWARAHPRTSA